MILCFVLFVSIFVWVKIWEEAQLSSEVQSVAYLIRHEAWQSWFVLTGGILSTGLLGTLLMLGTGQAYRGRMKREELEIVLNGTPFMLTRCGRDLRYRFVSASCAEMLGSPANELVGKPIVEVVGHEAFKTMLPRIEQVLQGSRVEYESEFAYRGTGLRTLHIVYTPDRNEDGEVIGWIASIRDITVERTLLMEVKHRSNNLLAVVQSLAHRSLASGQSLDDAKEAFESRLHALARTNRQLTKSNWRGVGLREMVHVEMEPFGGRTNIDAADILIAPKQAEHLSLVLHELTTNAAKYGALSNANGTVRLSWTISGQVENTRVHLKWQESGGPPVVMPTRQGFGTALVRAAFPDVEIDYAAKGLRCEFNVLLRHDEPGQTFTSNPPFLSVQGLEP
jgi:PAS domain S-box-containing protein